MILHLQLSTMKNMQWLGNSSLDKDYLPHHNPQTVKFFDAVLVGLIFGPFPVVLYSWTKFSRF